MAENHMAKDQDQLSEKELDVVAGGVDDSDVSSVASDLFSDAAESSDSFTTAPEEFPPQPGPPPAGPLPPLPDQPPAEEPPADQPLPDSPTLPAEEPPAEEPPAEEASDDSSEDGGVPLVDDIVDELDDEDGGVPI